MTASTRKCGRLRPSAHSKRAVPRLNDFLRAPLPVEDAPDEADPGAGAPIAMGGNDEAGDCTIAGQANWFAICAHNLGLPIKIVAAKLLAYYFALTGGEDTGLNEVFVLQKMVKDGIDVGDGVVRKNALWVRVNMRDHATVKFLIWKFWALYLGAELPDFALRSNTWFGPPNLSGSNAPKPENGHCFLISGYGKTTADGKTPCTYDSWGTRIPGDLTFADDYVDEGYLQLDEKRAEAINVDWDKLLAYAQSAAA